MLCSPHRIQPSSQCFAPPQSRAFQRRPRVELKSKSRRPFIRNDERLQQQLIDASTMGPQHWCSLLSRVWLNEGGKGFKGGRWSGKHWPCFGTAQAHARGGPLHAGQTIPLRVQRSTLAAWPLGCFQSPHAGNADRNRLAPEPPAPPPSSLARPAASRNPGNRLRQ
jgi:hypothetical protein